MTRVRNIDPASMFIAQSSAERPSFRKPRTERLSKPKVTARSRPEILDAPEFFFAEDYHQQYLAKNPMGYCGLGGTGVSLPDRNRGQCLEHDPEKWVTGFRKRSCSNKGLERDETNQGYVIAL